MDAIDAEQTRAQEERRKTEEALTAGAPMAVSSVTFDTDLYDGGGSDPNCFAGYDTSIPASEDDAPEDDADPANPAARRLASYTGHAVAAVDLPRASSASTSPSVSSRTPTTCSTTCCLRAPGRTAEKLLQAPPLPLLVLPKFRFSSLSPDGALTAGRRVPLPEEVAAEDARCVGSFEGWLVGVQPSKYCRDGDGECFLVNAFSHEMVRLPHPCAFHFNESDYVQRTLPIINGSGEVYCTVSDRVYTMSLCVVVLSASPDSGSKYIVAAISNYRHTHKLALWRRQDALHLFDVMPHRGVQPDLVSHTVLIDVLCKSGRIRDARRMFDRMVQSGLSPDAVTYSVLIAGYCNEGRMREARLLLVKRLKDQLFVARSYYPSVAKLQGQEALTREMKKKIQDHERVLSVSTDDADLPSFINTKIEQMEQTIAKAKSCTVDCHNVDRKLRQILDMTKHEAHFHMKQSAFLYNLGAQTLPKSHHCFSMRLTLEYFKSSSLDSDDYSTRKFNNPKLRHYICCTI